MSGPRWGSGHGATSIRGGTGYDGREALIAAAPLDIQGQRWVIAATMTREDAFLPPTVIDTRRAAARESLAAAGLRLGR